MKRCTHSGHILKPLSPHDSYSQKLQTRLSDSQSAVARLNYLKLIPTFPKLEWRRPRDYSWLVEYKNDVTKAVSAHDFVYNDWWHWLICRCYINWLDTKCNINNKIQQYVTESRSVQLSSWLGTTSLRGKVKHCNRTSRKLIFGYWNDVVSNLWWRLVLATRFLLPVNVSRGKWQRLHLVCCQKYTKIIVKKIYWDMRYGHSSFRKCNRRDVAASSGMFWIEKLTNISVSKPSPANGSQFCWSRKKFSSNAIH